MNKRLSLPSRFFFGGGMLEELGGRLYWGGEFMLNPSLIDKSRG